MNNLYLETNFGLGDLLNYKTIYEKIKENFDSIYIIPDRSIIKNKEWGKNKKDYLLFLESFMNNLYKEQE